MAKDCAKNTEDRYQTANEFSAALAHALAGQPEVPHAAGGTHATPDPQPKTAASVSTPRPRTNKKWLGATASLIAAVAIGLSIWFMRPADREPIQTAEPTPGTVFRDCDICPEMVVIPDGEFVQETPETNTIRQADEGPSRLVSIDYTLAVSRTEISQAEFARFADDTGHEEAGCNTYDGSWTMDDDRSRRSPGFERDRTHPATCISWNDAQSYVDWISKRTGRTYRLLSASEWEYAARAGISPGSAETADLTWVCDSANAADRSTDTAYPGWNIFNCRDNYVHTAPVGSFQADAFGLYDMIGNVFEWVTDCWNERYQEAPSDGTPWVDGDCGHRVLRGGSWFTPPGYVNTAFHNRFDPDYRSSSFGFRVARMP